MADFKDLLEKITDEDLRKSLEEQHSRVVRERGEFGLKLKLKDDEIGTLKASSMEYGKAQKMLEKSGVKAEDIPAMLEKLGLQKTVEGENAFLSETLKTRQKELTDAKAELNRIKAEKAVGKLLEAAKADLKDAKGKPVKIADHFIDLDSLYEGITDFGNEAVLKEKVSQVLKTAAEKQATVLGDLGFQGVPVHRTPDGKQTEAAVATSPEELRKIAKEHGAAASISAYRQSLKDNN